MTIYPVHLKQTAHSVKYRIETTRKSKEEEDEKQMKKQLSLQERAHKFSPKTAIGYALQDGTNTLGALLVSYVTYFATDSLFLSATSIGMVLAFSRVFDGITDLIAGALIDKTKTRWGKARPFVLVGFLYWISLLAIFATPASLSDIGKLVWIMITYNLNGAVFNTLIGTAKPVLLRRTTIDDNARIKTLTMTSLLMNVAAVVVSVILPLIIAKNNTPQGWLMMGVVFAVIGCISTAITFFCCVEYTEEELVELGIIDQNAVNKDKLSLKDSFRLLTWNIGFAGFDKTMDFFMDGGKMVRPRNREQVIKNMKGIKKVLDTQKAEVYFLQEVDLDSSRSYRIDQHRYFEKALGIPGIFAWNYKCDFIPYPLPPLGKMSSGLSTFTGLKVRSARRLSLPESFSWPVKTCNLKRCILETRISIKGSSRELVLFNFHLEA